MYLQQLPPVSIVQLAEKENIEAPLVQCVHVNFENYKGTYGLKGVDELAARFMEGVLLSVQSLEDGLIVNQSHKITFRGYAEGGKLAIFSDGYEFELNVANQPIAIRHGDIQWVFWGI